MSLLSESEILRILREQNSWWVSGRVPEGLAPSFKRNEYEKVKKIFFNKIRRFPVLSGPRRVGKSTIMFQIIDELLQSGVNPSRIMYYTLDEFPNDSISVKDAVDIFRRYYCDGDEYYLFIDEAQKDPSWKNYLKTVYDLNPKVKAMVTGSASVELEKNSDDSGTGRFFTVKIPTLSFYEYCELCGKHIKIDDGIDIFSFHKLPIQEQTAIVTKISPLHRDMIRYLTCGGFPEFVGSDDYSYISILIRDQVINKVVRQDIPRAFNIRNTDGLANLYTYFCFNSSEVVNIDTISNLLQIDRNTCTEYIRALEKANLIYVCEQLNLGGKKPLKPRRKIHIADNAIICAVTRKNDILADDTTFGAAVETAAYKHTRDYFDSIDSIYNVGYTRSDDGKEIDIVVQENSCDIQYVEEKNRFDSRIRDTDGIVVYGMADTPGYVITRNDDDFGLSERKNTSLYRIPATVYLYLLGKMKR